MTTNLANAAYLKRSNDDFITILSHNHTDAGPTNYMWGVHTSGVDKVVGGLGCNISGLTNLRSAGYFRNSNSQTRDYSI